jgi:hypothetical protein
LSLLSPPLSPLLLVLLALLALLALLVLLVLLLWLLLQEWLRQLPSFLDANDRPQPRT